MKICPLVTQALILDEDGLYNPSLYVFQDICGVATKLGGRFQSNFTVRIPRSETPRVFWFENHSHRDPSTPAVRPPLLRATQVIIICICNIFPSLQIGQDTK